MSTPFHESAVWERIALVAAVLILLSPAAALYLHPPRTGVPQEEPARFVGSEACARCHKAAYDKWRGSDHDRAMEPAAEDTVLGDFNNVTYTDPHSGVVSRFYRRDKRFFVETEGPDGKPGQFEVTYTFGVYPLQQYLVPFPGGRLQCLNIAWDVERRAWYRLPPYDVQGPGDWLHWTNGGQTWNVMCAECHSTRVRKGYDPEADAYHTTWAEIDVGCEACHGPGSRHVAWADLPPLARADVPNYALTVCTSGIGNEEQVRICAPCHARRFQLGDNSHGEGELLDLMVPQLLGRDMYFPDGQIEAEDYVYGSFVQSKMYARGVRCGDCHDVHGLKRHKEGNDLCTQCHRAEVYDTPGHHFHKREDKGKPSEGYLCIRCHMPERTYMGIDRRADHSLRVPRPDLSVTLGTPNACSAKGCHDDKSLAWNVQAVTKWYGEKRKPHYGTVIAAGRAGRPEAEGELIRLAGDGLSPSIVRATALELLRDYPSEASRAALARGLEDADALIRYTAIRSLAYFDAETRLRRIAPKLYDPVKGVRMEAAALLSSLPESDLREADREAFRADLEDYRQSLRYNADFAAQRYNLGNLAVNRGDDPAAERDYRKAIAIDDHFYPAKVNLAMLYNRQGDNVRAERLLREVTVQRPDLYEVAYSLGLLLAEMGRYTDAETYLGRAAEHLPENARAQYNYGQVLLALKRPVEAEAAMKRALDAAPHNQAYFVALANFYLASGRPDKARDLALRILERSPGDTAATELLRHLGR
ncbi:Tetratricopeptide TPR_1 repeat-containing protein [Pseudodesulfovibrio mercurii]|uniref:Tetratricopeptide TPR_1 repeat-containing protein n=1 Tax=Pseudodesulfovibrio mercurii TaxID=641491 RepID=F0JGN9_9BACT|nr:tetratricopeptide repeat protein [Pseudodesulfovibrio mercurii]EGB13908.1 Tetratricopeptide TPR_1 repeat-containing protein [Pseudodesulfovibrio mercurii]